MSESILQMIDRFRLFMEKEGYSTLAFIIVFLLGVFIIQTLMRILKSLLFESSMDKLLVKFILILIKISLYIVLFLLDLYMVGVDLTGYIAGVSAIFLAIGLSIKDIISGVASGMMLLSTHPFKVGDYVEFGTVGGTIREVTLFHTVISTPDNKQILVPNKNVFDGNITNFSTNSRRRLDLLYGVDYKTDIKKALGVLLDTAKANKMVLSKPEPQTMIMEYAESSINLNLRIWVLNENYWTLKFALQEAIGDAFRENEITFPFPQVTVSHRKGDEA